MSHTVYISHTGKDAGLARELCEDIEQHGLKCWIAPRDILPGSSFGDSSRLAIERSEIVVVVLSHHANSSPHLRSEIKLAASKDIPIIPYRVDTVCPTGTLEYCLRECQWFDDLAEGPLPHSEKLIEAIKMLLPKGTVLDTSGLHKRIGEEEGSRGYVFLSYVRSDCDFVAKLRGVLGSKRYGYWDYDMGDRDYHGKLYRELEERIDGAAAFMTIVSDEWRESDWVASEFIYAREAKIPIFVIEAKKLKKPLPILLNLHTRIDFSEEFDKGCSVLVQELSKKGL